MQKRAFKLESVICFALACVISLNWVGFVAFLLQASAERAGFWFMQKHLSLGESPAFVLSIAGDGLPQPFETLLTRGEFQVETLFSILMIVGLVWLAFRLWKAEAATLSV